MVDLRKAKKASHELYLYLLKKDIQKMCYENILILQQFVEILWTCVSKRSTSGGGRGGG